MTPTRTLTATSLLQRMGTNKAVSQVMRRSVPLDRSIARLTGGRLHLVPRALLPQLILTTTGRRSSQPRTTPLIYIEDGNDYVVVASNFGQNRRPAWSYNLEATPSATITIGRQTQSVRAQRLTESERTAIWPKAIAVWPAYRDYERWADDRTIDLYRLEPT
ncbi:nitroreductase family deazaflavin-dependent oxidoreductase [Gordonia jacobaea]|uniref:nitroreductase family deazaflavin-dependent oxidoreductase n=1 Tax=Gordonia jacobaea TaxID=122202 RepID=UPI003D74E977